MKATAVNAIANTAAEIQPSRISKRPVSGAVAIGSSCGGFSNIIRASPIACSRCFRSFVRHRRNSLRIDAGVSRGSALQWG